MKTILVCSVCEKSMELAGSKMTQPGRSEPIVTLRVMPHSCKLTEKSCTLSEALDELKNEMVEVAYYKQGGAFRELTGFFPLNAELKPGYVTFIETVGGEKRFKNLIRRSISSLTRKSDDFMFIV